MRIKCHFCKHKFHSNTQDIKCPECGIWLGATGSGNNTTDSFSNQPTNNNPYPPYTSAPPTASYPPQVSYPPPVSTTQPPPYTTPGSPQPYTPQPSPYQSPNSSHPPPKKKNALIISIGFLFLFTIGIFIFFLSAHKENQPSSRAYPANTSTSANEDSASAGSSNATLKMLYPDLPEMKKREQSLVSDFYRAIANNPLSFESTTASKWVKAHKEEPDLLRYAAAHVLAQEDDELALLLILTAYSETEDIKDIKALESLAQPSVVLKNAHPVFKASLEELFGKPVLEISWQDLGTIRSFSYNRFSLSKDSTYSYSDNAKYGSNLSIETFDNQVVTHTFYEDSRAFSPQDARFFYNLESLNIQTRLLPFHAFQLQNLKECSLGKADGMESFQFFTQFPRLTTISVSALNSTKGLADLPDLTSLSVSSANLGSYPFSTTQNITTLKIYGDNKLTSLDTIGELSGLTVFHYQGEEVKDFRPLKELSNLREISLTNTRVRDLAWIHPEAPLESLSLWEHNMVSLDGIEHYPSLKSLTLTLKKSEISTQPLLSLSNLEDLQINGVTDLSFLSAMPNLTTLAIESPAVADSLAPIGQLSNLKTLRLGTKVGTGAGNSYYGSLAFLSSLPQLESLTITKLSIFGDANSLFSLSNLKELYLTDTGLNISTNVNFGAFPKLHTLKLSKLSLYSNVVIEEYGAVTNIYYDTIEITPILPQVASLPELKRLDLSSLQLRDIYFLEGCTSLEYLSLADNDIADVEMLDSLANLQFVNLSENPIILIHSRPYVYLTDD